MFQRIPSQQNPFMPFVTTPQGDTPILRLVFLLSNVTRINPFCVWLLLLTMTSEMHPCCVFWGLLFHGYVVFPCVHFLQCSDPADGQQKLKIELGTPGTGCSLCFTPTKVALIKTIDHHKCWQGCRVTHVWCTGM